MSRAPLLPILLALASLALATLTSLASCTDSDIRKGCGRYCKCYRGRQSGEACRSACEKTLTSLKKRDRALARQVADCLSAKGKRPCKELALCAEGVLEKP